LTFTIALFLSVQGLHAAGPDLDLESLEDSLRDAIEQLKNNFSELGRDIEIWSDIDVSGLPHAQGSLERSFDREGIERLTVDSKFLEVTVTGHDHGRIDVSADIDVRLFEEKELEQVKRGEFIDFERDGNELRIRAPNLGTDLLVELARMDGGIRIQVPRDIALSLKTRFAKVRVKDHQGPLRVDTKFGDMEVIGHSGNLEMNASYVNLIIEGQEGDTHAQLQFCDTQVDGIEGNLTAETQYGHLSVDRIAGDVNLRTQGTLELGEISGDLELDTQFGDADIGVVEGDLRLYNQMGNVQIERVSGQRDIECKFGNVKIMEVDTKSQR
jgi:hypothetical protein